MLKKIRTLVKGLKHQFNSRQSRLSTIAGIILCILVLVGVWYIAQERLSKNSKIDCKVVTDKSRELVKQKKFDEAHDYLVQYENNCKTAGPIEKAYDLSKTNGYTEAVAFNADMALITYKQGDKAAAKNYALEAKKVNLSLSDWQRSQILDANDRVQTALFISIDAYVETDNQ